MYQTSIGEEYIASEFRRNIARGVLYLGLAFIAVNLFLIHAENNAIAKTVHSKEFNFTRVHKNY